VNADLQTGRNLSAAERELITALAPGSKLGLNDALVTEMQDGGMGSIRFVGGKDRRRAGSIAEATYLDDDGVAVSIELNVDEAGRLFELDFWKVDFSPVRRYPSSVDLQQTNSSTSSFALGRTRAEALGQMSPQLLADVYLYPTAEGGKNSAVGLGWGCLCSCSKSADAVFYDGWPLLDAPFAPGERRRLGFVFLHGKYIPSKNIAGIVRRAGTFYLWEGRFIGEATVLP
jgi:Domain of unknown function (DUF6984)